MRKKQNSAAAHRCSPREDGPDARIGITTPLISPAAIHLSLMLLSAGAAGVSNRFKSFEPHLLTTTY